MNPGTEKGRKLWEECTVDVGFKNCQPVEISKNIHDGTVSRTWVLPSLPLNKLFKLLRKFNYAKALGEELGRQVRSLSILLLEVFECCRNRNAGPEFEAVRGNGYRLAAIN